MRINAIRPLHDRSGWRGVRHEGPRPGRERKKPRGQSPAAAWLIRGAAILPWPWSPTWRWTWIRAGSGPRKFTVAADRGQVIDPLGLRRTSESNVAMAASRGLHEQMRFSRDNVTSIDWVTYPILEMRDAPEEIDVLLLNRNDLPPSGAGEPATRTVLPAIANAIRRLRHPRATRAFRSGANQDRDCGARACARCRCYITHAAILSGRLQRPPHRRHKRALMRAGTAKI